MQKVGLFDDISSGNNKVNYEPITNERIREVMEQLAKTPVPKKRQMFLYTGEAGAKQIDEALFEETIMDVLLTKLSEAYIEGKFTAEQYTKVEKLIQSRNHENVKFAVKLLQTKTDLDIRILTKYK